MNIRGVIQLLFVSLVWSGYYVCTQYLNARMYMFTAGTLVRAVTIALLVLFLICRGELKRLRPPAPARPRLILIGVLCFVLDTAAFIGFKHSSASEGTAILKCDIIFVNLISLLVFKKKPSLRNWLFSLLMLLGVFILLDVDIRAFRISNAYNLMFLVSALAVSCNAFLIQSAQRDFPGIDDISIAFYNLLFSGLCFLGVSIFSGDLLRGAGLAAQPSMLLALILGGAFDAALFIAYYNCLRRFSVWLVKVFLLTMPAISAAISFVCFGERLGARQLIGILVICLGAFLVIESERRHGENIAEKT